MLSLTQIELRKVISQELADAGINRNTLVDMVHKAVDDKVQKKLPNSLIQVKMESKTKYKILCLVPYVMILI